MYGELHFPARGLFGSKAKLCRETRERLVVFLAFLVFFIVGISLHRDYGISWDEPHQRFTGAVATKHLAERLAPSLVQGEATRLPRLDDYIDRDHGTGFELPAAALEAILGLKDKRDIYMFRHLLTFLVCFLGAIALYRLAARRFGDWRLGLLAALFLVLSPRLFAESFYNSKDAVFMAVFAIGMTTAISFLQNPGLRTALLFAAATAFAIDIRLMAVILPVLATGVLAARLLRRELPLAGTLAAWATCMVATGLLAMAGWVWLWSNPIGNLVHAFASMAQFRWAGDILFRGELVAGTALPAHYILTWITVTTPPLYLLLFVAGIGGIFWNLARSGARLWRSEAELQDLIFVALLAGPIVVVAALQSVLYGGWRHLYFVYPAFLLIAVRGWQSIWTAGPWPVLRRAAVTVVTLIGTIHVAAWMWRAHPLQNVYFNALAGANVRASYDLDYWGLGNRLALEHILKNDPRTSISVGAASETPVENAFAMIAPVDRKRLKPADGIDRPDYVIDNYYGVRALDEATVVRDYDLFYEHKIDGEIIFSVFRLKPAGPPVH
jgi:hypothetical protein